MRIQEALEAVAAEMPLKLAPEGERFARDLALGVMANKARIGELIREHLTPGWPIERLAVLDRLAIALATFEMYDMAAIPPKVSISEAVALAKRYGDVDSGKFVNGVLAGILRSSPKANWLPRQAPPEEADEAAPDPEPEIELVEEGSPELEELQRSGRWRLRAPDNES